RLLPSGRAVDWWAAVRKGVVEPLGLVPRSVLPVGPRIAGSEAEILHGEGVRWALWDPFSPWELRFAVSAVLFETDPTHFRLQTRIPCSIACVVESQSRTTPAQVTDLSTGGAFVQLAHPLPEGSTAVLRLELDGHPIAAEVRVAWRSGPGSPSWLDRGMGLEFRRIELATLDLLRHETTRAVDRFRLRSR